jgi:hypothetical protein
MGFKLRHRWRFPSIRFAGSRKGFDHRHVPDGTLQRYRQFRSLTYAFRKEIALNRVLIGDLEFQYFGAPAREIKPVVDKYPTSLVRRRIERYFYFDATRRSQYQYALVGHDWSTAGEDAVPRRKLEDAGGQDVNLHIRIRFG